MKIKTIAATALTVITILGATPMSSMAASYSRPINSSDFWRIGNASYYRNCNNYNRVISVGDANEDGSINLADVVRIMNVANNGFRSPSPNNWDARLYKFFNSDRCDFADHMDINGDGAVTQRDSEILQAFCVAYSR